MADYWKSNAKKFCEICKCWFADNKISVEHHERGQKHQAMVQQRLREMGQRAKAKEKQQGSLNATLIAMEAAALAAMKKDGHEVPEAASTSTKSVALKRQAPKVDGKEELKERKRKLNELKRTAKKSQFWDQDAADDVIEWVQAESDGAFYYWNIFSGETTFQIPTTFYTTKEYNDNFESITKRIEAEKIRLEEEEVAKKDAEEQQRLYNEQYQQYCQQYYDYQLQAFSQVPPPPPPCDEKEQSQTLEKDGKKEADVSQIPIPPTETTGKPADDEKQEECETGPVPDCTVYVPLSEDEVQHNKKTVCGIGEWVPVKKSPPRIVDLQQQNNQSTYDDLPAQETKPAEPYYDEDEQDAETDFKEKTLPAKSTNKKSKPVQFQKRRAQRNLRTKHEDD